MPLIRLKLNKCSELSEPHFFLNSKWCPFLALYEFPANIKLSTTMCQSHTIPFHAHQSKHVPVLPQPSRLVPTTHNNSRIPKHSATNHHEVLIITTIWPDYPSYYPNPAANQAIALHFLSTPQTTPTPSRNVTQLFQHPFAHNMILYHQYLSPPNTKLQKKLGVADKEQIVVGWKKWLMRTVGFFSRKSHGIALTNLFTPTFW